MSCDLRFCHHSYPMTPKRKEGRIQWVAGGCRSHRPPSHVRLTMWTHKGSADGAVPERQVVGETLRAFVNSRRSRTGFLRLNIRVKVVWNKTCAYRHKHVKNKSKKQNKPYPHSCWDVCEDRAIAVAASPSSQQFMYIGARPPARLTRSVLLKNPPRAKGNRILKFYTFKAIWHIALF
jgi:hypothetical protein